MAEIGVYEAMRTLRAVRRLRPDPIPDDVVYRVLEAATWAPSGGNRQPWRIIVVRERMCKERLAALYGETSAGYIKRSQARLAELPPAVREKTERMLGAGAYLAAHFADSPLILVVCFNPEGLAVTDAQLDRVSVVGGGSIYPAVENLLLACRAEGLGCTLTTMLCRHEPQVREILGIPQPWGTAAVIPIGYPMYRGHGPISRRSVAELTFTDSWGKPFP
jgi:nitroreductase